MNKETKAKRAEFGDFQTPLELARQILRLLRSDGYSVPAVIIEPSCGRGSFLQAAAEQFPDCDLLGIEINPQYARDAQERIAGLANARRTVINHDFFSMDWAFIEKLPKPRLVIGNPPWVTNSALGSMGSKNMPRKANVDSMTGIEAITGKSNFDISEAMLLRYLEWLQGEGTIAVLCKTSVARKVLPKAWNSKHVSSARIYRVDAKKYFDASVDACLFILKLAKWAGGLDCETFDSLQSSRKSNTLRLKNSRIIAGDASDELLDNLWKKNSRYTWRSGIKHDASSVMELRFNPDANHLINGFGADVDIEADYLYPLLKSSDIANGRLEPRSALLVTQRLVGEPTSPIRTLAPKTWEYLETHAEKLDGRGSSIYAGKAQFSIFGVGAYSFSPWKVAISALYKKLCFAKVGSWNGRPIVFDDTISFLSCESEEEADYLLHLLSSEPARIFLNSMIDWSDKRPITVDILQRLSIDALDELLHGKSTPESHNKWQGQDTHQLGLWS